MSGLGEREYGIFPDDNDPNKNPRKQSEKKIVPSRKVGSWLLLSFCLIVAIAAYPAKLYRDHIWEAPEQYQLPSLTYPLDAIGTGFEQSDCWFQPEADRTVQCGFLSLKVDSEVVGSDKLTLPVVIFHAPEKQTGKAPVVYMAGGPGSAELLQLEGDEWSNWVAKQNWLKDRDFILMEQRGVGYSHPSLDCPEMRRESLISVYRDYEDDVAERELRKARITCKKHFQAQGGQISQFNSVYAAGDFEALRKALGHEKIVVFGVSAGGTIAMEFARHFENSLEAMILDSPFPPGVSPGGLTYEMLDENLARLEDDCNGSLSVYCTEDELEIQVSEIYSRLAERPLSVPVENPFNGMEMDVKVDGLSFSLLLHQMLSFADHRELLAELLMYSDADQDLTLHWIGEALALSAFTFSMSDGAYEVYACLDHKGQGENHSMTVKAAERKTTYRENLLLVGNRPTIHKDICRQWGINSSRNKPRDMLVSDVKTLVLLGALDINTHPKLILEGTAGMGNSNRIEFFNSGHAILFEQKKQMCKSSSW